MPIFRVFIVVLLSGCSLAANAKLTIPWLSIDLFPCHNESPSKRGYCDTVTALILKEMLDYQFEKDIVSLPRMSSLMTSEKLFCTLDLLQNPDREKHMAFSQPVFYLMPPVLVSRRGETQVADIMHNNELSLDAVLNSSLRLGIRSHRHYTKSINQFIEDYEEKSGVYHSRNDQVLIDMILGKRLDILFLNAAELPFFDTKQVLVGHAVKDQAYIPVPISCTDTLLGRRVIEDFNQVISKFPKEKLAKPYESFLPASLKDRYTSEIKALSAPDRLASPN